MAICTTEDKTEISIEFQAGFERGSLSVMVSESSLLEGMIVNMHENIN